MSGIPGELRVIEDARSDVCVSSMPVVGQTGFFKDVCRNQRVRNPTWFNRTFKAACRQTSAARDWNFARLSNCY